MESQEQKGEGLALSLLGLITGFGLLGLSTHLAIKGDFLASVILNGGDRSDYAVAFLIVFSFIGGIIFIVQHISKEGLSHGFLDYPPF